MHAQLRVLLGTERQLLSCLFLPRNALSPGCVSGCWAFPSISAFPALGLECSAPRRGRLGAERSWSGAGRSLEQCDLSPVLTSGLPHMLPFFGMLSSMGCTTLATPLPMDKTQRATWLPSPLVLLSSSHAPPLHSSAYSLFPGHWNGKRVVLQYFVWYHKVGKNAEVRNNPIMLCIIGCVINSKV